MKRLTHISALTLCMALAMGIPCSASGPKKDKSGVKTLDEYLAQFPQQPQSTNEPTLGSLWQTQSSLASVASDYRALRIGDAISIQIIESMISTSSGSVNTQRQGSDTTGITALPGKLKVGGITTLFADTTNSSLKGSGATAYNAAIRTTLAGQIVAMLPNGNLVVEARRSIGMNNDHQAVVIRGMVRPSDIGPSNAVLSTQLSNLELEIKGKGIVADNVRQPNIVFRTLMKLIGI